MAKRRRNESPERQALREMVSGYLKENPVKNGADVNSILKEMMSIVLEGSLDGELDEELGYSKYDYRNKETYNSRNGYNTKTLHTSFGDMELDLFNDKWGEKYPKIAKSWKDNWVTLSTYFKYPEAVRRLIYTTNAIEGFNRQLRKVTKSKTVFPTDDSLLKMLYLATMDITKKWTVHRQDWGQIHSQLEIYFEERLS